MSSSSSSAGHCPPTIHELLCCLRNSQEPCRHSCHASSMICRGQRIAVEGRRGMLLPACRLQPAGVEALVRTKKNLHGDILKRLLVVCFNGGKKEQRRKLTVWGAWQCLEIPIHAILVSPDINSAAIPSADNSPFLSLFGGCPRVICTEGKCTTSSDPPKAFMLLKAKTTSILISLIFFTSNNLVSAFDHLPCLLPKFGSQMSFLATQLLSN